MKKSLLFLFILLVLLNCKKTEAQCNISAYANDTIVCLGDSMALGAATILTCPTLTLSWAPIANVNPSTGFSTMGFASTKTTYTVTGTDGLGNQYTDTITIHVSACASVEENTSISKISIYPLPAKDKVSIEYYSNEKNIVAIQLTNISGQAVNTINHDSTPGKILL